MHRGERRGVGRERDTQRGGVCVYVQGLLQDFNAAAIGMPVEQVLMRVLLLLLQEARDTISIYQASRAAADELKREAERAPVREVRAGQGRAKERTLYRPPTHTHMHTCAHACMHAHVATCGVMLEHDIV